MLAHRGLSLQPVARRTWSWSGPHGHLQWPMTSITIVGNVVGLERMSWRRRTTTCQVLTSWIHEGIVRMCVVMVVFWRLSPSVAFERCELAYCTAVLSGPAHQEQDHEEVTAVLSWTGMLSHEDRGRRGMEPGQQARRHVFHIPRRLYDMALTSPSNL